MGALRWISVVFWAGALISPAYVYQTNGGLLHTQNGAMCLLLGPLAVLFVVDDGKYALAAWAANFFLAAQLINKPPIPLLRQPALYGAALALLSFAVKKVPAGSGTSVYSPDLGLYLWLSSFVVSLLWGRFAGRPEAGRTESRGDAV